MNLGLVGPKGSPSPFLTRMRTFHYTESSCPGKVENGEGVPDGHQVNIPEPVKFCELFTVRKSERILGLSVQSLTTFFNFLDV